MKYSHAFLARLIFCAMFLMLINSCAAWHHELDRDRFEPAVMRHTLKELRDQYVVKQQQDYSCGAAALATLMMYYFGEQTSEREILDSLISQLTEEQRQQKALKGFSLLDLKQVAEMKGYQAAGFKLTATQLLGLSAPVIVFLEVQGYKHFAVLRAIDRGRAYLADPARGNMRMSFSRFLDEWRNIVFVLGKKGEEQLKDYQLAAPKRDPVQPELLPFSGQLDLGLMNSALPLRALR
jgi:predicted double-glycine peptidase